MIAKNYPTQLHKFLSEFSGGIYDVVGKFFHFPLKNYTQFVKVLRNMKYEVIHEIPKLALQVVEHSKRPEEPMDPEIIPSALWNTLFPFQKEGVRFAVSKGGRALIADEMGLGKTLQAIAIAVYYRKEWPVLIVCPSSLRIAWGQQIEKWLPNEPLDVNIVMTSVRSNVDHQINVVSFALAAKMSETLLKKQFKVAIVDERLKKKKVQYNTKNSCRFFSHYLKNQKTKRSKAVLPILQKANRCILLSGTPAVSRPVELFSQLQALSSQHFPNFSSFGKRYCGAKPAPWGTDYTGCTNPRELNVLLSAFMIRRKKTEVLDQLPEKIRQKVLIHVEAKHMKTLQNQIGDLSTAAQAMFDTSSTRSDVRDAQFVKNSVFFEVYRNTGRAKLPSIAEYVLEQLGDDLEGPKMLVFAHHQDVLDGLEKILVENKYGTIRIDGKTPAGMRQPKVDCFQNDPNCRVAILSITAAGVGLTLTAASFVVFAELFYNPGALLQAEDRAHRKAFVYFLSLSLSVFSSCCVESDKSIECVSIT